MRLDAAAATFLVAAALSHSRLPPGRPPLNLSNAAEPAPRK
jgi:hypothetical protein